MKWIKRLGFLLWLVLRVCSRVWPIVGWAVLLVRVFLVLGAFSIKVCRRVKLVQWPRIFCSGLVIVWRKLVLRVRRP